MVDMLWFVYVGKVKSPTVNARGMRAPNDPYVLACVEASNCKHRYSLLLSYAARSRDWLMRTTGSTLPILFPS